MSSASELNRPLLRALNPVGPPYRIYQDFIDPKSIKASMSFEPKQKVELDPPKHDPISVEYLSKCDGKVICYLFRARKKSNKTRNKRRVPNIRSNQGKEQCFGASVVHAHEISTRARFST